MPTITIGSTKTYATPQIAWDTLSGSDQGGTVVAEIDAEDYPVLNITSNSVNPWIFKGLTEYDGTGTTEDLLPRFNRTIISSALTTQLEIQDVSVYSSNVFQTPWVCSADNNQFSRLIIQQTAVNNPTVQNSAGIVNTDYQNCVILGGADAVRSGFAQGATKTNCLIAGANDKGVEASGGSGINIVDKCFVFENGGSDLDVGQMTITDTATEDGTGTYTGYTKAECVDFDNRDYRTKSTSALATIAGGSFVGAFLESSSGITLTVDDINSSQTLSSVTLTLGGESISVNDILSAQNLTEPSLLQSSSILSDNLLSENNVTSPEFTQANILTVDSINNDQSLSNVLLSVAGVLETQGLSQDQIISSASLIQKHLLITDSLSQSQQSSKVTLSAEGVLSVDNILSHHTLSNSNLITQVALLTDNLTSQQFVSVVSFEDGQDIGTVTAAFKENDISVKYGILNITVNFKE